MRTIELSTILTFSENPPKHHHFNTPRFLKPRYPTAWFYCKQHQRPLPFTCLPQRSNKDGDTKFIRHRSTTELLLQNAELIQVGKKKTCFPKDSIDLPFGIQKKNCWEKSKSYRRWKCMAQCHYPPGNGCISHLAKRRIIFKHTSSEDILVPRRVFSPS